MGNNGEADESTKYDTAGARLRRLARSYRCFADNLDNLGSIIDTLGGDARTVVLAELASEAGELGDQHHDLRRALSRL